MSESSLMTTSARAQTSDLSAEDDVQQIASNDAHPVFNEYQLKKLGKKKFRRSTLIVAIILTDILAIICAFTLTNFVRHGGSELNQAFNVLVAIIPIYLAIALNNKAYQTNVLTSFVICVTRGVTALLLATSAMLLILFFFKTSAEFSRIMFGVGTLGAAILMVATRAVIFWISKSVIGNSPYAHLCIYDEIPVSQNHSDGAIDAKEHNLVANPGDDQAVYRLGRLASGMDRVIVHCTPEKREAWVFMLRALDVKSEIVVPELQSIDPLEIKKRNGKISLLISAGQLRWDQKIVKRSFDLVVGSMALVAVLPIMLVTAIAIKLESKGPVLFKQERIGLGNRIFKIYKFRSMRTETSDAFGSQSTERDDPRVTTIGKFIRRTSIDEIPQLLNVVGGSMSLVGPRPHPLLAKAGTSLFWEVEQSYWHRHCVKPGITGLAQVRGHRGNTFVEDDLRRRLNADLNYVARWSLFDDIKILLRTISVLRHQNAF